MQSKYKVGLLRLNLMVAALLPALMAPASSIHSLTEQLVTEDPSDSMSRLSWYKEGSDAN